MQKKTDFVLSVFQKPELYLNSSAYNIRIRQETVQGFLKYESFTRILDIGCGDGSLSLPLLNSRRCLTLLDFSGGMLSVARSRIPHELIYHVEILKQDALSAKFCPHSFDVILCIGVLAHLDPPDALLEKISYWLKPGGSLILQHTEADHIMTWITRGMERFRGLFRPEKYERSEIRSSEVLGFLGLEGFALQATFRYSLPLLGTQRIASQEILYRMIRFVFGAYPCTRMASWGNECLYHLKSKTVQ